MDAGDPNTQISEKDINHKIEKIQQEISAAEIQYGQNKGHQHKTDRTFERSLQKLQELFKTVTGSETLKPIQKEDIELKIMEMIDELETKHRPNRPQSHLTLEQQKLKDDSLRIMKEWEDAGSGVNLEDLTTDDKNALDVFTSKSMLPTLLITMIQNIKEEDKSVLLARNNLAVLIFQTLVCRFGLFDKTGVTAGGGESRLELISCIAKVAVARCQDKFNFIYVLPDAANADPVHFFKDAAGASFATLVGNALSGATGLVGPAVNFARELGQYMIANPVSSFLAGAVVKDSVDYVDGLITSVLKKRGLDGDEYKDLFVQLSKYYKKEGIHEIIGAEPIDEDTIISKLGQLLYKLQFRCVAATMGLGEQIRAAAKLPQTICSAIVTMISSAKSKLGRLGITLIDRYGFIPDDTEKTLFQEVIQCLELIQMLEDPYIKTSIYKYLKLTKPQIPFAPLVQLLAAQSDVADPIHKPLTDSLTAEASESQQEELEVVGLPPSLVFDDNGNIIVDPYANAQGSRFDTRRGRGGGMKTKRRKLPTAKKQQSKKNKRQSRRKSRRKSCRSSSRKERK